ncbi:hypothetical protein ACW5CM_00815 [Microbacterium sp. A588]
MFRDLAEFFLPIGYVGVAIAVLCAIVAAIALARGAAGASGGAVAVWLVGAMLSLASGFAGMWIPALISVGALIVALVAGGLLRGVVNAFAARPEPVRQARPAPVPTAAPSATTPVVASALTAATTVTETSIPTATTATVAASNAAPGAQPALAA